MRALLASGSSGWIADFVDAWGYLGVFAFLVVENVFPPIPSELVLPLSGYYVDQGTLSFPLVVIASTAGSVVGALILYIGGQRAGRPVLERWGHKVRIEPKDLDRADAWFARFGPQIVFFGRLVPGVRSVVSVPAGAASMPMLQFVILTTAGSAIWNGLLIGVGWWLGSEWETITGAVGSTSSAVVVLVGGAGAVAGGAFLWRRRRQASAAA